VSGRSKEESHDYRYFPEPDLVPVEPSAEWLSAVRSSLPARPSERRAALAAAAGAAGAGVEPGDVALLVERGIDDWLAEALAAGADARLALTHAEHNLSTDLPLPPAASFAALVSMQGAGQLTATQAKTVLADMQAGVEGGDPTAIAAKHGFEAMAADSLADVVDQVIAARPSDFDDLKAGNQKVIGLFVGEVMKATGGKANGKEVTALLRQRAGLS